MRLSLTIVQIARKNCAVQVIPPKRKHGVWIIPVFLIGTCPSTSEAGLEFRFWWKLGFLIYKGNWSHHHAPLPKGQADIG